MFDTMMIAKVIRQARIDRNMTQMNLADAMGVSYQAVSNWERGNSMPDISKLEQLCDLLGITVNELLGIQEPAPTKAEEMTVAQLAEAAPALPPAELKARMKSEKKRRKIDLDTIIAMAPFLDEATLGEIMEGVEVDDPEDLAALAPFLSREVLESAAARCDVDDLDDLGPLAPFLSKALLEQMVVRIVTEDPDELENISAVGQFLEKGALARIVKNML